jgi:hypothetical protein
MKRFLDLRGQIYLDDDLPADEQHVVFAFYDTRTDQIESFDGDQVFESWSDFTASYSAAAMRGEMMSSLERYRSLSPAWVFIEDAMSPRPNAKDPAP